MIHRTPPAPHLSFVDGLRALAVLGVVIFHVSVHSAATQTTRAMALVYQGMHGVELFFVISGFCLSYPLIARLQSGSPFSFDVKMFAAKRLVRIFPPYLAVLVVLIALSYIPAWHGPVSAAQVSAASFSLLDIGKEAVLLDAGPLHNKSFWSLALELRWYAIFPLAIALFLRAPRALWVLCLLSWVLYYQSTAGAADLLMLPAFFLGIIAADAYIRQPRWVRFAPYVMLAGASVGLAYAAYNRSPYWDVAAFGVVLCAVWSEGFRKVLSWRPLTFIGVASYSIYLVHEPVIVWAQSRGAPAIVAGLIAIGCGIAFWWLVERPTMRGDVNRKLVASIARWIDLLWAYLTGRIKTDALADPTETPAGAPLAQVT